MNVEETTAQQVALYGETWASRIRRLLVSYQVPQSKLAGSLGLSAPMLSQLINAQRVKVSNPAVLARIVRLEEIARDRSGDRVALEAGLLEVAGSTPVLSTMQTAVPAAASGVAAVLAQFSTAGLLAAGDAAERAGDLPLAAQLRQAANGKA